MNMRPVRSLRSERGIALPVALGMMLVLSISIVAAVEMSSSGQRSADRSKSSSRAYNFAEAGLAEALSIIEAAANPTTLPNFSDTKQLDGGGEVTYSASYVQPVWTITSTGSVPNPAGQDVTRTLGQTATVQPLVPGATPPEWDRLFHNRTDICLTINTVTVPASVTSAGDLCLVGTGKITGTRSAVEVGDDVRITESAGPTQSPNNQPGAGSGWTNSNNVASSDNLDATTTVAAGAQSANLDATAYNFAIPSNAVIGGIIVRVERAASGSSIDDEDMYLLKGGTPAGSDRASTSDWPTSDGTRTYGSSSDLWGTTWTPAEVNALDFGVRLRADNDSGSSRTLYVDRIEVEVFYYVPTVDGSIGESGSPITRAEVVGTCQKGSTGPLNAPCSSVDNVFANSITQNPPNLQKPEVDMQYWYDNAKPGPKKGCDPPGSFPGGFDNNTTMDASLPDYGNDNEDLDQLTPSNSSYTCKVTENGELVGEVSWNHTTHVLTLHGQIFIDGNVRFDKDGTLVNYNGRAIMYAGGDLEFDEVVCAGGDGTNNCWAGDMSDWDPEENMLIILSRGWSEYDQGNELEPAAFQGVMYADGHCQVHQAFRSSGPIICDEIRIQNTDGQWPTFYEWPELQSLIAGQMYGSFANADDYALILGNQTG